MAAPIIDDAIKISDCWVIVWEKLKASGWTWGPGNKNHDFIYKKPNISSTGDSREGVDYFVELDHLKKICKRKL